MIDKQFDDILKRRLNEMRDTNNSDWNAFEQKLNNTSTEDISGEGFDNAIKQKLAGMTTASTSSDWSDFEHILDEDQLSEGLTDQMLDEKVSTEMNNMRAAYRHDHWELLHDNLELQKARNRKIIGYKIMELSLVFIILLSANNFYKYLPSTFEVEKPKIYASLTPSEVNTTTALENTSNNLSSTPLVIQNSNEEAQTNSVISSISINQSDNAVGDNAVKNNVKSINENIANNSFISKEVVAVENVIILNDTPISKANNQDRITANRSDAQFAAITTINPVFKSLREPSEIANSTTPITITPYLKSTKSISAYVGVDNNLVNSPFDDVYDVEGFRTYGIGYSAGIDYNIKRGKREWTLGLGYSNRSYEPRIIDELTGDAVVNLYDTSLEHIEFDILSLTAGLRYALLESDAWSLDIGIGASANIVAKTNYTIETINIIRDGVYVNSRVGRPMSLDLDDKPLHDGIYEGGSLKENIYLTTDLSIGIRRMLSDNTALTIRPEYSLHSFSNGIGPNNDLINNLSLNLGVQYML